MNGTEIFISSEFGKLEILLDGDKFWFPAIKCAEILGYRNPHDAVQRHCKVDGVVKREGVSLTTNQHGVASQQTNEFKYISEGNLYRLIVRSKLESAQRFERWVFDEILPTVRRHGVYATPEAIQRFMDDPKSIGDVFYALAAEQEKSKQLSAQNQKLAAKAAYCDKILQNPEAVPVTMIAKDYGMSARRFNSILEELGVQYRLHGTWALYQKYAGNGYTHGNVFFSSGGHPKTHTCWTQRGRLFLYRLLKDYGILPCVERKESVHV